jgi:hypothetical protein
MNTNGSGSCPVGSSLPLLLRNAVSIWEARLAWLCFKIVCDLMTYEIIGALEVAVDDIKVVNVANVNILRDNGGSILTRLLHRARQLIKSNTQLVWSAKHALKLNPKEPTRSKQDRNEKM